MVSRWGRCGSFFMQLQSLCDLNILLVPKQGHPGLSYQLAQMWGRSKKGRGDVGIGEATSSCQ